MEDGIEEIFEHTLTTIDGKKTNTFRRKIQCKEDGPLDQGLSSSHS